VHFIELTQRGPLIVLDIQADGFLHHMVRNIAGVLMAIGQGKAEPEWAQEVLAGTGPHAGGRNRTTRWPVLCGCALPRAVCVCRVNRWGRYFSMVCSDGLPYRGRGF
jgi:hypothetical protein